MLPQQTDQLGHDSTAWKAPCTRIVRARAMARPGMEENMSHLNRLLTRWIVPLCLTLTPAAAVAQTLGSPEHFTAAAINMNRRAAGPIEIQVDHWSTDAQRNKLVKALETKGADKLLDVLQDLPVVGHFNSPGRLGIDIRFARHQPGEDGGERVVLVTDRRIGFLEAANQPRSIDYPFTVIDLQINSNGRGSGKMTVGTKITADREERTIVLENYSVQPVMLNDVRREK